MEAVWNLEDKWKLSTQQAFLLFTCTAVAVVGLCAAAWVKNRKAQKKKERRTTTTTTTTRSREMDDGGKRWSKAEERCWWAWVRWSRARRGSGRWGGGETPVRLLGGEGEGEEFGSRNSTAAVWQRPILMGEKCEMLKYSGLILYDERGRLLHDQIAAMEDGHQEGEAIVVKKTRLKDLL